ncbi:glycosyltransferase [Mesorhizobium sp. M0203]|uniref:glycosyltransferase n=1 Tax=Mesorhizobium sp. M0203 TaxID=2956912 RepID=UPI00333B5476
MRIFVDATPLSTGGGVQVTIALLLNLQTSHNIAWQALLPEEIQTSLPSALRSDERVSFLPKSSIKNKISLMFKLPNIEKTIAPDVVFTVFGPAYFSAKAPHLVGFALPNLVYRDIGLGGPSFASRLIDVWRRFSLRRATHLIVETETVKERLALQVGIARDRISVVGNSVNPILRRREKMVDPTRTFRFLVPSAYYRHKNLEIVPLVAKCLTDMRPSFDFEITLTLDRQSAQWLRIRALAAELGVQDRVTTLGHVNIASLSEAYSAASAIFLPTLIEVSTAVYPESFFFRRPLVTSDRDFARELCGDAALFVDPLDAEDMAVELLRLASDTDLMTALVEAGARQLDAKFPTTTEKFQMQLNVLSDCASGRRGRSQS